MNFDITTPGQAGAHLARPIHGDGLNVITYQRAQGWVLPPNPPTPWYLMKVFENQTFQRCLVARKPANGNILQRYSTWKYGGKWTYLWSSHWPSDKRFLLWRCWCCNRIWNLSNATSMITKYLILTVVLAVAGMILPALTRGCKNRTWTVFLLKKPISFLCFGLAVGFGVCALIIFLKR